MVRLYDNVFSSQLCAGLIDLFEGMSEQHEYINEDHKPCFTQLNLNQHRIAVVRDLVVYVKAVYNQYKKDTQCKYIPKFGKLEEFRLKRYLTNGEERFDEHVDVVDHSTAIRAVAFLFYLNDNNGNTVFPLHDLNIEPKRGRVLVFPPTWEYPHSGLPPSDTPKYIMSTYIHYGTN
jgi:hypothetical protein